jgi:hypothetical protein
MLYIKRLDEKNAFKKISKEPYYSYSSVYYVIQERL